MPSLTEGSFLLHKLNALPGVPRAVIPDSDFDIYYYKGGTLYLCITC